MIIFSVLKILCFFYSISSFHKAECTSFVVIVAVIHVVIIVSTFMLMNYITFIPLWPPKIPRPSLLALLHLLDLFPLCTTPLPHTLANLNSVFKTEVVRTMWGELVRGGPQSFWQRFSYQFIQASPWGES